MATTKSEPEGFDLALFDLEAEADKGATMELLAPRADAKSRLTQGQPLGITFQVLGDDSATFRANLRAMIDGVQANLAAQPKEPDAIDRLTKARVAACALTDWLGVVYEGKPVPFSRAAAEKLFTDRPWAARQVENFRTSPGNFGPR